MNKTKTLLQRAFKEKAMTIEQDKQRLTKQINRYLAGKHDNSKKRIAETALITIPLSVTYSELLNVLTILQQELAMLVAAKNAHRWFKHKAGAFDKLLKNAIENCQRYAQAENRIGQILTGSSEAVTLKDWNRNNGGKAFLINKVGFAISNPTIPVIDGFLNTNGINSSKIRQFICDFCNQDGLHAIAHLFPMASREATGCIASQASGKTHEFTSQSLRKVHVKDSYPWNMFVSETQQYQCDPAVLLVIEYDLVEAGGKVQVSGATFSYGNLSGAPLALRKKLPEVLSLLKTMQSG